MLGVRREAAGGESGRDENTGLVAHGVGDWVGCQSVDPPFVGVTYIQSRSRSASALSDQGQHPACIKLTSTIAARWRRRRRRFSEDRRRRRRRRAAALPLPCRRQHPYTREPAVSTR